jgi:hypothetical protein
MQTRELTGSPRWLTARRIGALVLVLAIPACLALVAAGCGAGAKSPSVASIGTAGSTTRPVAPPPPSGSVGQSYGDASAYSQCMRGHGLPDFPDPNSQGRLLVNIHPGSDLSPSSAQYQSANKACHDLLPNGGQQTQAQEQQDLARLVKYAQCMRSYGIPSFPDPTRANGHASLIQKGSGIDQNSPQFQNAQQACRSLSPGG